MHASPKLCSWTRHLFRSPPNPTSSPLPPIALTRLDWLADRQKVAVPASPHRDVQDAKNYSLRIRCSLSLHVSAALSWWRIKCRALNHDLLHLWSLTLLTPKKLLALPPGPVPNELCRPHRDPENRQLVSNPTIPCEYPQKMHWTQSLSCSCTI